jgi:DNA-binding NarL/FixJ family response regulator
MTAGMTILILDGHQGVRNGLARRLGRQPGVQRVVATATLRAALSMGRLQMPDLVICDPKTVGYDLGHDIRRLRALGCPVLVLTSSLDSEERALIEQAGAALILFKGIGLPALCAGINLAVAVPNGRSARTLLRSAASA